MPVRARAAPRTRRAVLGDLLLWVAAVGGALCLLAVVAATVFRVTLIMFSTGSMAPAIPTGSVAVVHEIPASEVRVGDVVTVDRAGQLPITHRVTSVHPVPGSGSARELTLRGDANAFEDPAPYEVESVRIVWASVPGLASVLVQFSNPVVLGGLTLLASGIVTWAFWPRAERRVRAARAPAGAPARAAMTVRTGFRVTLALLVAAGIPLGAATAPARAAETETVIRSTYLELTSVSDPALMTTMEPGEGADWQVGVAADAPERGTVHIGLALDGSAEAAAGFVVAVDACAERWVAGDCATGAVPWLAPTAVAAAVTPVSSFDARELGTVDSADRVWVMLRVQLVDASAGGAIAPLRLQTWGVGDDLGVGAGEEGTGGGADGDGPGGLARTGADTWMPAAAALLAVAVGVAASRLGTRRVLRRRRGEAHRA